MLKSIEQLSGGVKFGAGFEFAAEILSRTGSDAVRWEAVCRRLRPFCKAIRARRVRIA